MTARHLRLASGRAFAIYREHTRILQEHGQVTLAERIAALETGAQPHLDLARPRPPAPWVLYHAFRPGFLWLSVDDALAVRALLAGGEAPARGPLLEELEARGWLRDADVDLDLLLDRVRDTFPAYQNRRELRVLLAEAEARRPRVVVEIGTARGGTLYALSQVAAADALLVSVDLPAQLNGGGQTADERALFATFGPPGQRFAFVPLDSASAAAYERVLRLLDGRAIELLHVDGDHSCAGVRRDVERYGPLVAEDGLVALHDISLVPEVWGERNAVGAYWRELRARGLGREILDPDGARTPQPDPNAVYAWGIGLLDGAEAHLAVGGRA